MQHVKSRRRCVVFTFWILQLFTFKAPQRGFQPDSDVFEFLKETLKQFIMELSVAAIC